MQLLTYQVLPMTGMCPPWCVDHAPEAPGTCFGPDERPVPGTTVCLISDPQLGGTTIGVYTPAEMSIPDAKALMVALQRQVDRAVTK